VDIVGEACFLEVVGVTGVDERGGPAQQVSLLSISARVAGSEQPLAKGVSLQGSKHGSLVYSLKSSRLVVERSTSVALYTIK
jgi:hypothetical protein